MKTFIFAYDSYAFVIDLGDRSKCIETVEQLHKSHLELRGKLLQVRSENEEIKLKFKFLQDGVKHYVDSYDKSVQSVVVAELLFALEKVGSV